MSLVIVREEPKSYALASLETVRCRLGVDDLNEYPVISAAIDNATSLIERYTDRVFGKRLITEQFGVDEEGFPEMSPFRVTLSQLPVLTLDAARYDGSEVDISEMVVENDKAGFIFNREGFARTNIILQGIERSRSRFKDPLWEFDYSAGFILPSADEIIVEFTNADVDATTDAISIAGHGLSNGDTVRLTTDGTLPAGLTENRNYLVRDTTAGSFKLASRPGGAAVDITDTGDAGPHTVTRQVTLPAGLSELAVRLTETLYQTSGRDRTITSEKLGDWSASYATGSDLPGGLPHEIASQLQAWIRY